MTPDKSDVLYGTLGLMVIKTLEALGPLHGYRIARRIEQISGNQLALNQGTLYPALLKQKQKGRILDEFIELTLRGHRHGLGLVDPFGSKMLPEWTPRWIAGIGVEYAWLEAHRARTCQPVQEDRDRRDRVNVDQ
jgi:hypothetical protein